MRRITDSLTYRGRFARCVICAGLFFVMLTMWSADSAEATWSQGFSIEIGGFYTSLDPELIDELKTSGLEFPITSIEGAFGIEAALRQYIGNSIGVFLRVGFAQDSQEYDYPHPIFLPSGTYSQKTEQLAVIPVTGGLDYRVQRNSLAVVFELGGTLRYVENTTHYDPIDKVIKREAQSWGAQGSVGLEWELARRLVSGFRAGYRVAEDVDFPGVTISGDGGFVGLYMGFRPWAPPN